MWPTSRMNNSTGCLPRCPSAGWESQEEVESSRRLAVVGGWRLRHRAGHPRERWVHLRAVRGAHCRIGTLPADSTSIGQSRRAGATAHPIRESAMPKYRCHRSSNSTSDSAKQTFDTWPFLRIDIVGPQEGLAVPGDARRRVLGVEQRLTWLVGEWLQSGVSVDVMVGAVVDQDDPCRGGKGRWPGFDEE